MLLTIPEIQTVARKTGRAELDEHALGVNVSEIEAPFELKDRSRSELVAEVREKLGTIVGANVEIGQPISHRIDAMLSGTKANIAIKLFGDDLNRMFSLGNEIKNSIQDIPGIADLNVEQQIDARSSSSRPSGKYLPNTASHCRSFRNSSMCALQANPYPKCTRKERASTSPYASRMT